MVCTAPTFDTVVTTACESASIERKTSVVQSVATTSIVSVQVLNGTSRLSGGTLNVLRDHGKPREFCERPMVGTVPSSDCGGCL